MSRRRIGPSMLRAVQYVACHPGVTKLEVATYLFPDAIGRNNAIAYGPVNRAIAAGWLDAERAGRGTGAPYQLYLAPCRTHEDCRMDALLAQSCTAAAVKAGRR